MRQERFVCLLLLTCVFGVGSAFAQTPLTLSPSTLNLYDTESFLSIRGSGLPLATPTPDDPQAIEPTTVIFTEQARVEPRVFTIPPQGLSGDGQTLYSSVPGEILYSPGTWAVTVEVQGATGVRTIGPATLTIVDPNAGGTAPPLLGIPETVVAYATSASGAVVTFTATYTSQGGTGGGVNCDHASGATYPIGTTTVQCTASDSNGSTTGSFVVVVGDFSEPVVTVPGDIVTANPVVTFTASAVDNLDGALPVTCSPASGSTFPEGETEVVCEAVDSALNVGIGVFKVTIILAPIVTVPADMTVEATGPNGAVVTFTATSNDPSAPVQCTPASGSTFAIGTTTVNCSATNDAGTGTASFKITVQDTTPPQVLNVTASPNVLWPPDHKMTDVQIAVVATDLVDPNPVSHIVSVTSNQPINGTGDGDESPDWNITGPLTLQLRAERAGNTVRIYTITIETTDSYGNTTTSTVQVKVDQTKTRSVKR